MKMVRLHDDDNTRQVLVAQSAAPLEGRCSSCEERRDRDELDSSGRCTECAS